ncbi:MAG: Cof-type HAD-IIB family hydrolase [Peptostreptococcaceae bacterium]|nr:Cof-type HAD-IIB family hydrolase [Peptostreptococcaceae bacterium]
MIKLIALDLDNTLLNSKKEIEPETLEALRTAKAKGVFIALVTGRILATTKYYANQIGEGTICVSFNGSVTYDTQMREEKLLSMEMIRRLADYCHEHELFLQFYDQSKVIVGEENDKLFRDPDLKHTTYEIVKDLRQVRDIRSAKAMIVDDPKKIKMLIKEIKNKFGKELIITQSEDCLIEILPLNAGKRNALKRLAESLGIKQQEVMACGDNHNDTEMVDWSGLGVAVANAVPKLKEKAQYITQAENSKGVLEAVKKFVL